MAPLLAAAAAASLAKGLMGDLNQNLVLGKGDILWEVVSRLARSHEHLAFLIRTIQKLVLHGHVLNLLLRVADANQVPECQEPHGMASSTHLLVHLERRSIVEPKQTVSVSTTVYLIATPDTAMVQAVHHASV